MKWAPQTFVKGFTPQVVLAVPAGALQFASYEWSKAQCAAVNFGGAAKSASSQES